MRSQKKPSRVRLTAGVAALLACLLTTAMALAEPAPRPPRASAPAASEKTAKATAWLTGVVNVNKATTSQLQLLPGIGKAKAQRILAWREKNGPFERVKDIRRVKGFGKKTVAKLAPYLRLTGATTLSKAR